MSEYTKPQSASGNHSAQWGLASILLGSLVLLLFPILVGTLFGCLVGAYNSDFVKSSDINLGITGGWVVVFGVAALSLFALICGVVGLAAAKYHGQPSGLSVAGTVVSLIAVAAMVVFFLASLRSAEWLRWLQKERFEKGIQHPSPEKQ